MYEGDFVDGNQTGKGKFTYANGNVYEGDWVDDVFVGKGKKHGDDGDPDEWTDRDEEMLQILIAQYSEKGDKTLDNGNVYDGDIVDGGFEGKEPTDDLFTEEVPDEPTSTIPIYDLTEIVLTFNTGNLVGNFFTDYDVKAFLSSNEKGIIIKAKIETNPTSYGYDFSPVAESIFNREIVKRTFRFESYTYQDVLCETEVWNVRIRLIGPSGDFKDYTHFLTCP